MARFYTTRQGETVDLICRAHYGKTSSVTEMVLSANTGLAALGPILPLGTVVTLPDINVSNQANKLVSLWD